MPRFSVGADDRCIFMACLNGLHACTERKSTHNVSNAVGIATAEPRPQAKAWMLDPTVRDFKLTEI